MQCRNTLLISSSCSRTIRNNSWSKFTFPPLFGQRIRIDEYSIFYGYTGEGCKAAKGVLTAGR